MNTDRKQGDRHCCLQHHCIARPHHPKTKCVYKKYTTLDLHFAT